MLSTFDLYLKPLSARRHAYPAPILKHLCCGIRGICLTAGLSQGQETGKGISPSSDNVVGPSGSDFFDLLCWLFLERLENLIGKDVELHGSCNLVETVGGVEIGANIRGDDLDDADIGVDQRVA